MTRDEVIAWLQARVRLDEDTGCLVWKLCTNNQGAPIASVEGKRSRAVRPWLFDHLVGKPRGDRKLVPRCNEPLCLNHEHLMLLTIGQINRRLAAAGSYSTPQRRMAQRRNGAKASPYSDALVAEARRLRGLGHTLAQIEAATKANKESISRWCRGERRVPLMPGSSAFHP